MEVISSIIYFAIVIAILVVIHEWGHYFAAKLTGMRADVFAVGMGRRVLGWNKKLGFTFGPLPEDYEYDGTTDWRLCLFPIGGYVKIPGMIDESMDDEYAQEKPQSYEFRSKNTFQKAFVLSAGVIMNFLLAVLIFGGVRYFQGEYRTLTNEISFVHKNSLAEGLGLLPNDKILKINQKDIISWEDMIYKFSLANFGSDLNLQIERKNETLNISVDKNELTQILTDNQKVEAGINKALGIEPANCIVVIKEVLTLEPAGKAGIQSMDTLISINNREIGSGAEMVQVIEESVGTLHLRLKRGERIINTFVTPNPETKKIGVYPQTYYIGEKTRVDFGIFEAVIYGYDQSINLINIIFTSFSEIFSGNIAFESAIGGPIMIAKQSSKSADMGLITFLIFIANLSISLALINILPIPALDGGHLIVVLLEGVLRRELSAKVKLVIQNVGMILLFALFIFVVYKDLMR
jgi:regulator of sigma E protease